MANGDTITRALADVRQQRSTLEIEIERIGAELAKLRVAEKSLAAIVEGAPLDESADNQPMRRRASPSEDQPRGTRGPRGPRVNSAKGRLKVLIEQAGSEGLTHSQIAERLADVAASTLNTYLSMMSNSGERERHGDIYRSITSRASEATSASNDDAAEDNQLEGEETDAAE